VTGTISVKGVFLLVGAAFVAGIIGLVLWSMISPVVKLFGIVGLVVYLVYLFEHFRKVNNR